MNDVAKKTIDCIRILSLDCIEQAKSGHPGLPLGIAEIMYILWQKHLIFNPNDPKWLNRDRFILSAGHGSAGLYSVLHLYGFLPLEELKNFRQYKSKTPGHPEYRVTDGVEVTTGPLGQGLATSVGIALGAKILKSKVDKISKEIGELFNHKVYVIASDGDLMEGISYESCSLAGHLNLDNLIVIYDSNNVTIDGSTDLTFSEDVELRFKAFGWEVIKIDGHNLTEIDTALTQAKNATKPVLIIAKTKIAKCSPNFEGSNKAHGAPLGEKETCNIKQILGWQEDKKFFVPQEVKNHTNERIKQLQAVYEEWNKKFKFFLEKNSEFKNLYENFMSNPYINIDELEKEIKIDKEKIATRVASGMVLQSIAKRIEKLVVGSADLAHSTNVELKEYSYINKNDFFGRNIHYGIREFAMGAISNGLALYGFIPVCSTFLVFSDYMRPSIRLAALMNINTIFVFTHDSVFLGEDGPTHQPVEHLWSLRAMPNLYVIRPADIYETLYAWALAINKQNSPKAIILTRQDVPVIDRKKYSSANGVLKGGYIIAEAKTPKIDIIIIATGSEVSLALEVKKILEEQNLSTRVISMPCVELFEQQSDEYKNQLLPKEVQNRVAIEAGRGIGWYKYLGKNGLVISIEHFGHSAPLSVLQKEYGFTPEKICEKIKAHFNL